MSMLSFRRSLAIIFSAALLVAPAFASRAHRTVTSGHANNSHRVVTKSRKLHGQRVPKKKLHGQQAIDSNRVTEIQQALIREHYLTGEANGEWDASTAAAMQKFQGDQGWQTKLMPDSRAIKKLGLGPDYSSAINAKDSSFGAPPPGTTIPQVQSNGFAAAAGVNR